MQVGGSHRTPEIPDYQVKGDIKGKTGEKAGKVFTQDVKIDGKSYTITLKYASETTPEKAKTDMDKRIGQMVLLAKTMGLGTEEKDLKKITVNQSSEVIGKWTPEGDNKAPKFRLLDTLNAKLPSASPEEKAKIEKQIKVIKDVTDAFRSNSLGLPPSQSNRTPERPPDGSMTRDQSLDRPSQTQQPRNSSSPPPPPAQSQGTERSPQSWQRSSPPSSQNPRETRAPESFTREASQRPSSPVEQPRTSKPFPSTPPSRAALSQGTPSDTQAAKPVWQPASPTQNPRETKAPQSSTRGDSQSPSSPVGAQNISRPNFDRPLSPVTQTSSSQTSQNVSSPAYQLPVIQVYANAFNRSFEGVKQAVSNIELQEKLKQGVLLENAHTLNEKLDKLGNTPTLAELSALRQDAADKSSKSKEDYNNPENHQALEKQLLNLTKLYNTLLDQKTGPVNEAEMGEIVKLEREMLGKIRECNEMLGKANLTTNMFSVTKSHVMNYNAVVEKKLSLMEERAKLQATNGNPKEIAKIDKALSEAPKADVLEKIHSHIKLTLDRPQTEIVSPPVIKAAFSFYSGLSWGSTHLNQALTNPLNWTDIHSSSIKTSKSGMQHVATVIIQPLNIGSEGGVPSGLRAEKGYDTRTTNFMQTTSYLLGSDGKPIATQVSFRGGQFATKEAAKEAILTMINSDEMKGKKPEEISLHISGLLTPMFDNPVKKDKQLLEQQKENISEALQEIAKEQPQLASLKNQISISNLGVNEGAVRELRVTVPVIGTIHVDAAIGWHNSIGGYTNEAVQQFNKSVESHFGKMEYQFKNELLDPKSSLSKGLDKLGALVEVGQEMEAIWAKNDYADAKVGNNQFKFPALWKTANGIIEVYDYEHCMSGKDRTTRVEGTAQEYSDEINMNIADQKALLKKEFDNLKTGLTDDQLKAWNSVEHLLTAACFRIEDIQILHSKLQTNPDTFIKQVGMAVEDKITRAKRSLGLGEGGNGFLQDKKNIASGYFHTGVNGIPTNKPLMENVSINYHRSQFPSVAVSSVYGREKLNMENLTPQQKEELNLRQREAVNRRISQLSGMPIPQMNTGKPGTKVDGGEPLARFSSGFDRDFVIMELMTKDKGNDYNSTPRYFSQVTGLHELDKVSREAFQSRIDVITKSNLTPAQKIKAWTKVITEIEEAKQVTLFPLGEVPN